MTGHDRLPKGHYFSLIRELNNGDVQRRHRALHQLRESQDLRSVGPTTRRLFDADPEIRALAGALLEDLGLGESTCALSRLYADGESARRGAAEALEAQFRSEMPGPHHAAIATAAAGLHELYEELALAAAGHDNTYVRRAATEGLHHCNHPALAPTFLLPAADSDWMVRRYSAVGLAENHLSPMAARLQTDPHPETRSAARRAWARPGEPVLVRDPHRRDMEASSAFAFPACGSAALPDPRMPRLRALAREEAARAAPTRAIGALYLLREAGASLTELEASLAGRREPLLIAFIDRHRPSEPNGNRSPSEPSQALLGRRVLVVGGDDMEHQMLDSLRTLGATPTWMPGFRTPAAHPTQLDLVVLVWRRVSHSAADHAAKIARQTGAPLVHARSSSASAVVDATFDGLSA